MSPRLGIILFSFMLMLPVSGQEFTVMFYNAENLFDTSDDSVTNDDEFLPSGSRRWTNTRYDKKLDAVARAVATAGRWDLPALAGLCEVENEKVVKDLAYGTILSAGNYGIVHRDSPDPRGIDLALLYRRDIFRIADVKTWLPETTDSIPVSTRNLLYVKVLFEEDTIHLILCHLPSRRGGVLAALELRERMARLLRTKVDSLLDCAGERAAMIVMGDFNAPPQDPVIKILSGDAVLDNLADSLSRIGKGSYRYQGSWEMIDQMLVPAIMNDTSSVFQVVPGSFGVIDDSFLLTVDETYPGRKPLPAYSGFRWTGGYSDHLPVVVRINHKK